MKKILLFTIASALIFALAACAEITTTAQPNNPQQNEQPSNTETNKEPIKVDLPQTSEINLTLEGFEETRIGKINRSAQDFYIYLIDGYKLEERTGSSAVVMAYDKDFYAEITNLGKITDISKEIELSKTELKQLGELHVLKATDHFDTFFHDAKANLLASSTKGSVMILYKEVDGNMMRYRLNMPLKEAAEGAGPHLWGMLKTIRFI
ncbi:MAG: hypothetical protein AB2421_11990 [Thermotaleaceae bacterium]